MFNCMKKNWPAKIATLIAAIILWFLVDSIERKERSPHKTSDHTIFHKATTH